MVDPEGILSDILWVNKVYINYKYAERPEREWQVSKTGSRTIARALPREVVNVKLLVGTEYLENNLRRVSASDFDTGDEFAGRVIEAMKYGPGDSIARSFILNRATLSLNEFLAAPAGGFIAARFQCEVSKSADVVARSREIEEEFNLIVANHNNSVVRETPEEGVGLPNKL